MTLSIPIILVENEKRIVNEFRGLALSRNKTLSVCENIFDLEKLLEENFSNKEKFNLIVYRAMYKGNDSLFKILNLLKGKGVYRIFINSQRENDETTRILIEDLTKRGVSIEFKHQIDKEDILKFLENGK